MHKPFLHALLRCDAMVQRTWERRCHQPLPPMSRRAAPHPHTAAWVGRPCPAQAAHIPSYSPLPCDDRRRLAPRVRCRRCPVASDSIHRCAAPSRGRRSPTECLQRPPRRRCWCCRRCHPVGTLCRSSGVAAGGLQAGITLRVILSVMIQRMRTLLGNEGQPNRHDTT